jgi:ubiquinone/menaquinone biosynthesis C-methylase UbiE
MLPGGNASFMDPRTVITHFHLRPGDAVADFGAGVGHYIGALSRAVGGEGKVYACDIQKSLVERLTLRVHEERLSNVHPIWCDFEAPNGTKLADGLLDAGMLINTLFQIEDKASALTEMGRVIRKGGKFIVVEWADSFGGIGPHPSQVVKPDTAKALLAAHGFVFERDFPAADHHYGLAFKKQ